jgi:ABC-2 type transport system ATP-binding protein
LREGKVVVAGSMRDLLGASNTREITLENVSADLRKTLESADEKFRDVASAVVVEAIGDDAVKRILERALASGASITGVASKRESLEEIFVRRAL